MRKRKEIQKLLRRGKGVNEVWKPDEITTPPDEKGINEVLINQDIVSISKTMYKNMGYDIDKLEKEGKITLDLFARKGKNTHGFCFGVEAGKDSRILANLINKS